MDNSNARVMGGIFIALCSALSPEGIEMANDVLWGFANNPNVCPEDRRVYEAIAHSASTDIEEIAAENAVNDRRASFEVINGGNAA
jgi:hypothetical protein